MSARERFVTLEIGERQQSKKQNANFVMIKRNVPKAGNSEGNPGRRDSELQYPAFTLERTCVA
jgi:hypothetical protein